MKTNDFTILIKIYRAEHGYTMRKAASLMNISVAYLSDLENGNRKPTMTVLKGIINAYNLSEEDKCVLYDAAGEAVDSIGIDVIDYLKTNRAALLRVREEMKSKGKTM